MYRRVLEFLTKLPDVACCSTELIGYHVTRWKDYYVQLRLEGLPENYTARAGR